MAPREKIILVIKILLPVAIIILLNLGPSPIFLKIAYQPIQGVTATSQSSSSLLSLQNRASLEPWRGDIWEQIGTAELAEKNPSGAIDAFQKARALRNLSPQGVFSLGDTFLQIGDSQNAIQTWDTLTGNSLYMNEAYSRIVLTYRNREEFSAEESALHSWYSSQPQNSQAAFRLGLILSIINPADAVNYLALAASLDPSLKPRVNVMNEALATTASAQPESYSKVIIGLALGKIGEWALAENAFKSASVLSPEYAEAWAFLGEAKQQRGQDGYQELKLAEKINPESVIAKSLLSIYWQKRGETGKSLAYLYSVSDLEPKEPAWQIEIGSLLTETGNNTMALYHFQKAVDFQPSSPTTWQALANFSVKNDFELSSIGIPAARQAVALAPEDPQNLTIMGMALIATGDEINGENFLTRAVEADKSYVEANIQLGLLYNRTNHRDASFYYLNQAVFYSNKGTPQGVIARRLLKAYFGIDN